jgi:sugar/nucleoside kinase (ribokinase family)
MQDIIVVGELNVDIILDGLPSFPEVDKERIASRMETVLGSSSAIFASNISSLGMRVAFIGKLGMDDYSELIIDNLESKGVDTSLIMVDAKLRTGATVILSSGEDRMMVTYPGSMNHLTLADVSVEALRQAKHLHFSSFFIQPGLRPHVGDLMRMAKAAGLTTSLDLQGDPDETWDFDYAAVLPHVDVFLPNESELLALTGETALPAALDKLAAHSNIVAVKCGSKGCLVAHDGESFWQAPYLNAAVVDAIGAGDSFNAGFICKFKQGKPLRECADFANLMGAISTTAVGGTRAFANKRKIIDTAHHKFNQVIHL